MGELNSEHGLISDAASLAVQAHEGQTRADGSTPYVTHPIAVACIVAALPDAKAEHVAAALLHDVLEDTDVTQEALKAAVGDAVTDLVVWLTNPSKGSEEPREARKRMDREHAIRAPTWAQRIKLADRLHNVGTIATKGASFARLYAAETRLLVDAIGHAEPALAAAIMEKINEVVTGK